MNELQQFKVKVYQLLTKRKMMPARTVGLRAFATYFMAHAWFAHSNDGDGHEMLDILLDDTQLVGGEIFNANFVKRFEEIYPAALRQNRCWQYLMPELVRFKGKGLGVGELYLALVIDGWTFERTEGKGDGKVAGGLREIKNNGASLKPLAVAIRVQDEINRTIFEGHRAGPVTKFYKHQDWIHTKSDPEQIYVDYFSRLYPGKNVKNMCEKLAVAKDGTEFYNIIGREVLTWYKENDKWHSLIVINQDDMTIANLADVSDNGLKDFSSIRFHWKSERGGDSQAISDGYVNITI